MIRVLEPGFFTTVQDLGRSGLGHLGVPTAGAADTFSLRVANRLVGNADSAAALEMTARGAALSFDTPTHVAFAGAEMEASLDGQPLPMHQTVAIPAGALLRAGRIHGGLRTYLAVAGGFKLPPVLGSASSDTLAGLGPAPLIAEVKLSVGQPVHIPGFYLRAPPRFGETIALRILPGPQEDWFTPAARRLLLEGEYRVQAQSDRAGLRLTGSKLERARQEDLQSMGMVPGAVQVPGSGQPIVLLANHGATGGYPVIANVISADLPALGQCAPGARLRFSPVGRGEALALLRAEEERLARDIVSADTGLLAARALMALVGAHASLKQASVTDGSRRIRIRRGS
ncbi:MAG TPA: biotin-dependent carboxyltransferase family protein [Gammaproteobacteria bacterium]|nr:biotin-dependent carboxyltransferase family protein [Gammaproteobacteria bacterium]